MLPRRAQDAPKNPAPPLDNDGLNGELYATVQNTPNHVKSKIETELIPLDKVTQIKRIVRSFEGKNTCKSKT